MLNLYDDGTITEYDKQNLTVEEIASIAASNYANKPVPEIIPSTIFRYEFKITKDFEPEIISVDKLILLSGHNQCESVWPLFNRKSNKINCYEFVVVNYNYALKNSKDNGPVILENKSEKVIVEFIDPVISFSYLYYEDFYIPMVIGDSGNYVCYFTDPDIDLKDHFNKYGDKITNAIVPLKNYKEFFRAIKNDDYFDFYSQKMISNWKAIEFKKSNEKVDDMNA